MSFRGARNPKLVLVAMTLANAMILVDQTAMPLALPNIMRDFGEGTQRVQWVLTCSLLPLASLLVFGGRLGDLIGHRRVFCIGTLLFAAASAGGALAPDLPALLVARVIQGTGGALVLPATVAIVSATFAANERGRALGTMGGAAAIFAALGPTIGGGLTAAFDWRAVLAVNVPIALGALFMTRRVVPAPESPNQDRGPIDGWGTVLLSIALAGFVLGLSQSQPWGWSSPGVLGPIVLAIAALIGFVAHERRTDNPLVDFDLLRIRNYLGATLSQLLSGMAEIGLGVIFPLILILNMGMTPALAGLALIPTTLPMIVLAPMAGNWYDRTGGRPPLITGFLLLAASGVLMALAVGADDYLPLLPGLVLYGVGLALILTVNDPVTIDMVPERQHGEAAGVSATAEQFGGALGIAVLYSVFHSVFVDKLFVRVDASALPDLTATSGPALKATIEAAESTGLKIEHIDPSQAGYIKIAETASNTGYEVTFVVVAVIALLGAAVTAHLVRKPPPQEAEATNH